MGFGCSRFRIWNNEKTGVLEGHDEQARYHRNVGPPFKGKAQRDQDSKESDSGRYSFSSTIALKEASSEAEESDGTQARRQWGLGGFLRTAPFVRKRSILRKAQRDQDNKDSDSGLYTLTISEIKLEEEPSDKVKVEEWEGTSSKYNVKGEANNYEEETESAPFISAILHEERLPPINFTKDEEMDGTRPKDNDETLVKAVSSADSVLVEVHLTSEDDTSTSPKHIEYIVQEIIPVQETLKTPHGRLSPSGALIDNTRDKGVNSSVSGDPTDYILTPLTENEVERLETKAFKLDNDLNALNDWNFIQAFAAKREATQQEEEQISPQHVYVIVYVRTKMEKNCTQIRYVWRNSGFEKEFPHAKLMLLEYFSPSGIHVTADPENSPARRQKSAAWMKKMHSLVQNFYKDIRDKHSNVTYITADTLVYKERENRIEETDCIVVYVPYKEIVPIKEHFFPKTYKGFPVDIRKGVFEFLVKESFEQRLKAGCSVSKFDEKNDHLGTIGMFVKCRQTKEVGLLTAYHVITGDKEVRTLNDLRTPAEKKEILKLGLQEERDSNIGSSIANTASIAEAAGGVLEGEPARNSGDARGNEKTALIHQASCIDRVNAQSKSRMCAYVFDKIFLGNKSIQGIEFLKNIRVSSTSQDPEVPKGQEPDETFSDDQLNSAGPDLSVGVDALFAPVFADRAPTADFKDGADELPRYRLNQQLSFRNAQILPLAKLFEKPGAIESEDVIVYKNGCTTNLTQGKIRFFGSVAFPHDQNLLVRTPRLCGYQGNMTSVKLKNLLEVERVTTGAGPNYAFADGGDSGSIVFSVNFPRDGRVGSVSDDHIDIVGMLVGKIADIYVVTPIEAVFDALDVELLNDDDYNEIEELWWNRNIND